MKTFTYSNLSSCFISLRFSLSNQIFRSEVRYVTRLLNVLVEVFGFKDFK
ncbi:MAG: hypothetical protein V1646_00495 [bacterium]